MRRCAERRAAQQQTRDEEDSRSADPNGEGDEDWLEDALPERARLVEHLLVGCVALVGKPELVRAVELLHSAVEVAAHARGERRIDVRDGLVRLDGQQLVRGLTKSRHILPLRRDLGDHEPGEAVVRLEIRRFARQSECLVDLRKGGLGTIRAAR